MTPNITDAGLRIYELTVSLAGPDDVEPLCAAITELVGEVRRLRDVNATLIAGVGHLAREAAS